MVARVAALAAFFFILSLKEKEASIPKSALPAVLATPGGSWLIFLEPQWLTIQKLRGLGMSISTEISATAVQFDADTMWVDLSDARTLGVPLAWFPRLLSATPAQREACRIGYGGTGLHWDDLDEDISVAGLLEGRGDQTRHHPKAA